MLEATLIALDKASNAILSWVGLVWQTASVEVRFCQEEYLLKSLSEPSCLQSFFVYTFLQVTQIRWKRGVSSSFPRKTKIMPLVRNMEMDPYCPRHITLLVICEKRKRCASKLKPADTLRTA